MDEEDDKPLGVRNTPPVGFATRTQFEAGDIRGANKSLAMEGSTHRFMEPMKERKFKPLKPLRQSLGQRMSRLGADYYSPENKK